MFVNFNILNQLGSPAINSNTFANRPAAGQTGRLFVSTDTFEIYRDNGTTWDLIGGPGSSTITGTGTATQVAYFTSSQAIGSSANLFWDNTQGFLGVATATPTARIEAVKTDGIGIFANYTTNAGSGSSATGIYAINNTASSGYAAVIEEKTGNTTGGQYPLLVKHSLSSGTAGIGMGTGLQFQLPDDAGTFKTTQLTIETTDAAAATYSTRYRFNVQSNGSSTPMAYLNATGLGIKTATPLGLIHADGGASAARIILDADSGVAKIFSFRTDALPRWAFRVDGAETGSNAGANLSIRSYDDAGAFTFAPLSIIRATGESTFSSTKTYSTGNAIGVAVQHNLTIPNGVNVGLAALGGVNSNLNLTLQGSTTVAATGRQGLEGSTSINFTGAGTLTMTQGSTVRAFSALSSVYAFNGSAVGTITHLAGLRICFPDNVGSAVNITNNYALLINNQTTGTGTVTYTNRWGIYQEGASDLNYFAANTLIGTTVNSGYKLDVNGNITGKSYRVNGTNGVAGYLVQQGDWLGTAATNLTLAAETGNGISFFTNGSATLGMFLNSDNNLGLGVTPNTWTGTGVKAFQFQNGSLAASLTFGTFLSWNAYYDGSYKYVASSTASALVLGGNEFIWYQAPSGTAGNAITFTQAMTLDASGNLVVGATSALAKLHVSGYTSGLPAATGSALRGGFRIANSSNIGFDFGTVAAGQAWIQVSDVNNYASNFPLLLNPNGGNVLIGTTTDNGEKLQVNGTLFSSTGGSEKILIGQGYNSAYAYIRTNTGFNSSYNSLSFGSNFNLATSGQGNTSLPSWEMNLGGSLPDNDTFNIGRTPAGSFTFTTLFKVNSSGNIVNTGSITTGNPTTGTAQAWKLGSRVAATVVVNTTEYIEVDIGGTLYKLATVT